MSICSGSWTLRIPGFDPGGQTGAVTSFSPGTSVLWLRWSRGCVLAFSTLFAGSNPVEAVGFLGRKNPQYAFLRRGSKAVGPMS